MDQSEFDICSGDLPQRGRGSQDLVRIIDSALPANLVRRARAVIGRLGRERLRSSYFTAFWLPGRARPAHPVEEAVLALWKLARPRGCRVVDRARLHYAHPGRVPLRPGRQRTAATPSAALQRLLLQLRARRTPRRHRPGAWLAGRDPAPDGSARAEPIRHFLRRPPPRRA